MSLIRRVLLAGVVFAAAGLGARADDWPQWLGPQRDGVWRETGLLEKFPAKGPKVLWRAKAGYGYAGPAVAGGKVYVHDYLTDADVRALTSPSRKPKIKGKERVRCLDAKTGKELWKHEYDCPYEVSYPAGPRCTPTVHDGKVYTLGAMGDLYCLDAKSGKELWSKDFKKTYEAPVPVWGFCGHPLVDGKRLICLVGGKGSLAVAFDKDSGKELWKALTAKESGYCPPTLIEGGGKKQLLIWPPEAVHSVNPETGEKYWSVPLKPQYGMSIATPRQQGDLLFVGGVGNQCVCLRLEKGKDKPEVTEVWRGKRDTGVYPSNSTPFVEGGVIYGCESMGGELRAVELKTGKRLWATLKPTTGDKSAAYGTAFIVKNGDRFFLFSETGDLIIAKLSAKEYEEVGRWKMLKPTAPAFGRDVVWSHPAFAEKCVFARNDEEVVCASLAK